MTTRRLQRLAGDGPSLVARWLAGGEDARRTLACLFDRSSRPRHSPRQLASFLTFEAQLTDAGWEILGPVGPIANS